MKFEIVDNQGKVKSEVKLKVWLEINDKGILCLMGMDDIGVEQYILVIEIDGTLRRCNNPQLRGIRTEGPFNKIAESNQ